MMADYFFMAVDRQAKQRAKRKEKKKAYHRKMDRLQQLDKSEDYAWMAEDAYARKDYPAALNSALKSLKLNPQNQSIFRIAIQSAKVLQDQTVLYTLLSRLWEEKGPFVADDCLVLGQVAYNREKFTLAKEAFQEYLKSIRRHKWRVPETHRVAAERGLATSKARIATESLPEDIQLSLLDFKPTTNPKSIKAAEAPPKPGSPDKTAPKEEPIPAPVKPVAPVVEPKIRFIINERPVLSAMADLHPSDSETLNLTLEAYQLSFRTSYDQLICLPALHNIQSLWYQEATARKAMKDFRGRGILADEVGLGKTIEAGLILKEYIQRGLVRSALILTPSSLVNQWQEELQEKFDLSFISSNDPLFRQNPEGFWREPYLLVSLQTARNKRHQESVTKRAYDLLIVDEAHHLKNRSTSNWKLVNGIIKTFILLLTATPVQNKLEELYNLVTLLKPGHLKTHKSFKEEFVTRGNPTDPRNREKLRQLLKEVMVRNTRSITQLHLPPRFARTVRIKPNHGEEIFYRQVSVFVSGQVQKSGTELSKLALRRLLEAAGSSPSAAFRMLERMAPDKNDDLHREIHHLLGLKKEVPVSAKTEKVLELLRASEEQKIIFVNYLATLEHLHLIFSEEKMPHVVFQGSLTAEHKKEVMDTFKNGCPILLTTGTGGEGHNLQFCHTMINYDLPWNPMQIEQRIGRIHRIGQEHEVRVYNFCTAGSLEDHILEVLDRKINMFELVIGEIDMILGRLEGEEEFSDLVYDVWVKHPEETERQKAFEALAARLRRAKTAYGKTKELDEKLFREDFGV
jgi:SNF2 family DNA or RNA helicase